MYNMVLYLDIEIILSVREQ